VSSDVWQTNEVTNQYAFFTASSAGTSATLDDYLPAQFGPMVRDYQSDLLSTIPEEQRKPPNEYLDYIDFTRRYPNFECVLCATIAITLSMSLNEDLNMLDCENSAVQSRFTAVCSTAWIRVGDMVIARADRTGDYSLINSEPLFFHSQIVAF
jgi:hypothetical protein